MGRPTRIDFEGAWMHVGDKGADGQDIFSDDLDRAKFLELLDESSTNNGVEVHAFCLMTNHFHLVLRSRDGTLAAGMHGLLAKYARWYNHRHQRTGPLFTARYHSTLITDDAQAVAAVRYVHRNPLAFTAAVDLISYEWSSLRHLAGRSSAPPWLVMSMVRSWYSDADQLLGHTLTQLPTDKTPEAGWVATATVTCEEIEQVIVDLTGCAVRHGVAPQRGTPAEPDTLIMLLATELRAASTDELADRYGYKGPSSVRTAARRGRVWRESRTGFRRLHEEATNRLRRSA